LTMQADPDQAGQEPAVVPAAFFFDFDGTLTKSIYVERLQTHAVSDRQRMHALEALTPDELLQNFGGAARLSSLTAFLSELRARGAKLYVISHGLEQAIRPHLARVQLDGAFDGIYGTDTPELRACGGGHADKSRLIARIMAHLRLTKERAVFFEDTQANLDPAEEVCSTVLVGRGGMSVEDMSAAMAYVPPR